MAELQKELQRLSGSTLDAAGAANRWAGTTGLELVGALNVKAGTVGRGLAGVLRRLGRDLDPNGALAGTDPAGLSYVTNVIRLPGTAGNYASTPDSAALSITGDLAVRVKVAADRYAAGVAQQLIGKRTSTANQRSWSVYLNPTGTIAMRASVDGTTEVFSAAKTFTFTDGQPKWLRATFRASDSRVQFFDSADGVTWAQVGTDAVLAGVTALYDSTAPLEIGSVNLGTSEPFSGLVHYAEVCNGIGGTAVATFDPSGQGVRGVRTPSSWTGPQGNVWTVNGTGWSWTTSRATAA